MPSRPDVRCGHPCPSLTRRWRRSRPPGFAGHLRRLEGTGNPSLVVDCEELPCTQRPQAAPRAQARRCDASSSRRAPPPRGGHGRLDAGHRPAGRTLAATTPGQACGGHGWRCHSRRRIPSGLLRLTRGSPGGRAIARLVAPWLRPRRAKPAGAMDGAVIRAGASLRACFGLREARLEGEPSPGWSHLGCDHAGPSLRGPWMAPQALFTETSCSPTRCGEFA